jgi:DNA polymerase III subunit delta
VKLDARRLSGFLQDPGSCRAVLLYGEDAGLIRDRAEQLTKAVAGRLQDPFRIAELGRATGDAFLVEASALSLTGGRRVIRIRDATDALVTPLKTFLAGSANPLVVLEGAALPARSKLRALLEPAPDGAAIACYALEGRALVESIKGSLAAANVAIAPEALQWVAEHLGVDHGVSRSELDKLALYAGRGGRVELDDALQCIGDSAALSLDDAWLAALGGDVAAADRALELSLGEGATPVAVLRSGLGHVQRLHRLSLIIAGGSSLDEAVQAARPPILFRRVGAVRRALELWSPLKLEAAEDSLVEAEKACKSTGAPDLVICRHAVQAIASKAARRRRS